RNLQILYTLWKLPPSRIKNRQRPGKRADNGWDAQLQVSFVAPLRRAWHGRAGRLADPDRHQDRAVRRGGRSSGADLRWRDQLRLRRPRGTAFQDLYQRPLYRRRSEEL